MKLRKPETLDEAWEIIQAQACLIEGLQRQIHTLQIKIKRLEENGKKTDPPSFVKENMKKRRRKKKGPKSGHDFFGFLRCKKKVDEEKKWFLKQCPHCDHRVSESVEEIERYEIDIPPVEPIVIHHTLGRHWCSHCDRLVSASIPGLLPKTPFSQNIHLQVAHFKYGLGLSIEKIQALFREVYGLKISSGGLSEMLCRLGDQMEPAHWFLQGALQDQEVLHGDETGWRVDGISHWLWSFSSSTVVYYHIDRSRGQQVVSSILGESFAGILVSDFYSAYNLIQALKQKCWVHVLRDLKEMSKAYAEEKEVASFAKRLKMQIRKSLTLKVKQDDLDPDLFRKKVQAVKTAIMNVLQATSPHPVIRRLSKRLLKFRNELFLFLEHKEVPAHNNDAERQIRPAVLMRKISYQNASPRGARTQAVLMSIIQTCRKGQIDFFEWGRKYLDGTDPPETLSALVN